MKIFKEIKWAIQRVLRGYDDTIYWGFSGYLEYMVIPPLEKFCKKQLSQKEVMKLNPKRKEIYETMLSLIEDFKKQDYTDYYKQQNQSTRMWEYFLKNIHYFWD